MSSLLSSLTNSIPSLPTTYSGVPERLAKEARAAKDRLLSRKTVPDTTPRTRHSLPPDVDQNTFDATIVELQQGLGPANVQMNDKPLEDGWYMQHP